GDGMSRKVYRVGDANRGFGGCQETGRRTASGRGFANLAAADPAGDLETGSGPVPIAHPIEDLWQTDPRLATVDNRLQAALKAAQRPEQLHAPRCARPRPRPHTPAPPPPR